MHSFTMKLGSRQCRTNHCTARRPGRALVLYSNVRAWYRCDRGLAILPVAYINVDDDDPIDWLRDEIAKSPIPTLTGLCDAPFGAESPSSNAGLGTVSRLSAGRV